MALDFLIVQKESGVCPPRNRPFPWCQAHLEMQTAPPRTDRGAQKQRKEGLQPDEAPVETGAARAGGGAGR